MSTKKQRGPKHTIGRHAQDRIGRELRAMYEPFVQEPLPGEFLALLHAWNDAETARHRVEHAVEILREANTGFDLKLSARSAPLLAVHAQQMLLARAVRAQFGRPSLRRAPSLGHNRFREPVSVAFKPVSALQARNRFSGAGDSGAGTSKSHAKARPETRKSRKATR